MEEAMKEHALHDCMQRAVAEFNLRTVEILRDYLATIGKKFSIPEMQRRFVRVSLADHEEVRDRLNGNRLIFSWKQHLTAPQMLKSEFTYEISIGDWKRPN